MVAILLAALKPLLTLLISFIIPAISFFIYYKFVDWFIAIALGAISDMGGVALSATGLGGWMLVQLRMAECISIYLAAVTLGFCLKLVRR